MGKCYESFVICVRNIADNAAEEFNAQSRNKLTAIIVVPSSMNLADSDDGCRKEALPGTKGAQQVFNILRHTSIADVISGLIKAKRAITRSFQPYRQESIVA